VYYLERGIQSFRFVGLTILITLGVFSLFQAKGYYAIGLYPVLLVFGAVWIADFLVGFKSIYGAIAKIIFAGSSSPTFPACFTLDSPFYSPEEVMKNPPDYGKLGLNRWETVRSNPIPQDFADMLGWRRIGHTGRFLPIS